jgi:hypothetical protein
MIASHYPYNPFSGESGLFRDHLFRSTFEKDSNIDNTSKPDPNLEKFLGFDLHFLSDILSPKVALCDKQFQLTVDDVTFIGHPTLLNADRPGTGHRFARMIQRKRLADLRKQDSLVVESEDGQEEPHTNFGGSIGGDMLGANRRPGALDRNISKASRNGVNPQLTMFNLVLALRPNARHGANDAVDAMYRHVISKVTAALKYEQLKRGYIKREAELILSIRDEFQSSGTGKESWRRR